MEITNVESVKLPNDIQKKVDAARNNVTLMEQETIRLNELKYSQESEIKENLSKLADLKTKKDSLSTIIETLKGQKTQLSNEISASQKTKQDLDDKIIQTTQEHGIKVSELNARESVISVREKELNEREAKITELSNEHQALHKEARERLNKIKNFISEF